MWWNITALCSRPGWLCSVMIRSCWVSRKYLVLNWAIRQKCLQSFPAWLARYLNIIICQINSNKFSGNFCFLLISRFSFNRKYWNFIFQIACSFESKDCDRTLPRAAPVGSCLDNFTEKSNFELEWLKLN